MTVKPKAWETKEDAYYNSEAFLLADEISSKCGDTYIECQHQSPLEQWSAICGLLKSEGYTITKLDI